MGTPPILGALNAKNMLSESEKLLFGYFLSKVVCIFACPGLIPRNTAARQCAWLWPRKLAENRDSLPGMTLFFAIYPPKIGGRGHPLPDLSQKNSKILKLGLFLVSNSTQNVHEYEQNARTKDTYPHGNAT